MMILYSVWCGRTWRQAALVLWPAAKRAAHAISQSLAQRVSLLSTDAALSAADRQNLEATVLAELQGKAGLGSSSHIVEHLPEIVAAVGRSGHLEMAEALAVVRPCRTSMREAAWHCWKS